VFLLCSDGVWEHVTEQRLEATLREAPTPRAWLDALEREVGAATQGKSSHDNFTAMTVWARGAEAH
jgi:serine/threonine protein phosphatase PrpC